ncbi:MAG: hypothetical protein LBB83_03810 [Treponema sp.]|nr:hypothetical protein [Treponema sp.]
MRFKVLVVLSNAILLVFILLALLVPFLALGPRSAGVFWQSAWPVAAFLFLVLLAMNLAYMLNAGLLRLLDREDWPALARCLEKRTIERGRYRLFDVQLLVNTYILLSDNEALANLENKVVAANSPLAEKFILIFGAARVMRKDYAGAVRFFDNYLAGQDGKKEVPGTTGPAIRFTSRESLWLFWYSGFALLLDARHTAAAERFSELARTAQEPVVMALAAWVLRQFLPDALPERSGEFAALAEESRKQVKRLLPKRSAWDRKTGAVRDESYMAIISRYLQSTADWLYNPEYVYTDGGL